MMKTCIRTSILILVGAYLSGIGLGVSPAYAQLRGEWPAESRMPRAGEVKPPQAERAVARPVGDELVIPRGDLRKDVSDASRDLPRGRGH
jgi:hypothetical protein